MVRPYHPAGEIVLGTFESWLAEEVYTSGQDGNKVLDNFDEIRERLTLPLEDDDNWFGSKHRSHIRDLELWWKGFEKDIEDDKFAALITFRALMEVSGMHRIRSNIQARTADEYMRRRRNIAEIRATKPLATVFNNVLRLRSMELPEARVSLGAVALRKYTAITTAERMVTQASERLRQEVDLDEPGSDTAAMLQKSADAWLKFAAVSVIFNAKVRDGDLSRVPMMQPMTISRSQLYYPWTETTSSAKV